MQPESAPGLGTYAVPGHTPRPRGARAPGRADGIGIAPPCWQGWEFCVEALHAVHGARWAPEGAMCILIENLECG